MQFPMLNHIWPKDAVEPWPSDFRARCHEFRAFALTCFRCQLLPPELLMVLAEFTFLFAEPIRLAEVKAAVVPYIIRCRWVVGWGDRVRVEWSPPLPCVQRSPFSMTAW